MYRSHNIEYFEILRRKDQEPYILSCSDDRFFEPVELVEQGNGRNGLEVGPQAALERSKTIARLKEGELVLVRYANGGGLTPYRTFRPKALQIREEELS